MFKARELSNIIKTCASCGVSEFSIGEIKITFGQPIIATQPIDQYQGESQPIPSAEIVDEPIEKEEVALKEEQLAMALLENPVELERLLTAGELENEH